jgi:hypothetical protein
MSRAGPVAANGRGKIRLQYTDYGTDSRTRTVKCKEGSGDCLFRFAAPAVSISLKLKAEAQGCCKKYQKVKGTVSWPHHCHTANECVKLEDV